IRAVASEALGDGAALVNTLPFRRRRLLETGGQSMLVELEGFESRLPEAVTLSPQVLSIDVAADGTFSVTDSRSGRTFSGLHVVEDEPDAGDLYTFCPDGPVRRLHSVATSVVRDDELVREVLIEAELPDLQLQTIVRVVHGSDRVEVRTTVVNHARDHRLRV